MNVTMMNGSDDRTQRARSAPPASLNSTAPQKTFVSTLNYDPKPSPPSPKPEQKGPTVIPIIREMGSNSSKNSTPNANRPSQQQQQKQSDTSGNIRHIPIFVEGRDKPVISKQQSTSPQKTSRPPTDDNENPKCSSPSQTPPMKKPTLPVSPLDIIKQTHAEVVELDKIVDIAPGGTRHDRAYTELEEALTRKLLQLDNIETEGREDIRQARKDCVKFILSCLAKLEVKYPTGVENTCTDMVLAGQNERTDEDVENVQQPLALMAVDLPLNETSNTNNVMCLQATPIPLPMPAPEPSDEPKKSQVVSMELTLASPALSNGNQPSVKNN